MADLADCRAFDTPARIVQTLELIGIEKGEARILADRIRVTFLHRDAALLDEARASLKGLGFTVFDEGVDMLGAAFLDMIDPRPPEAGFHVLWDGDNDDHLVAFHDGAAWWVPGSAEPFLATDVAGTDGSNPDARLHYVSEVPVIGGGDWKIANGRRR